MWHDIGPKFLGCHTVHWCTWCTYGFVVLHIGNVNWNMHALCTESVHWCTWCTLESYIGKYTVYMGVHMIVHECTWM